MVEALIKDFQVFLKLERGLSENSYLAYTRDTKRFLDYMQVILEPDFNLSQIQEDHILNFLKELNDLGIEPRSQSRLISSLRCFFQFLRDENQLHQDPMKHIKTPKLGRKLPSTLSYQEIVKFLK